MLSEAITALGDAQTNAVADVDHYYGGDAAKWTKCANTLKARFSLHLGNYGDAISSAGGGILANADNWMIPHTAGANLQDQNIWYSFGQVNREGYLTANNAYLPSLLDAGNANYRGDAKTDEGARFASIYVNAGDPANYDLNYDGRWSATSPYPLALAAETHLIYAESEILGNGSFDNGLLHLNHVRALNRDIYPSGQYDDYEAADFDDGGMANPNGLAPIDALLHEVREEKYASLVGQIEVFCDLRRTDNALGIAANKWRWHT